MEKCNIINTFIIGVVVIIAILIVSSVGITMLLTSIKVKEEFENKRVKEDFANKKVKEDTLKSKFNFKDTIVNQDLGYVDLTKFYSSIDNSLKETPIVNISAIESNRFPIVLETVTNWYDTQGMLDPEASLGTNNGKLSKSECYCNESEI
jgi:hypothetical protein